jgi:hypothetical protein
MKKAGVVFLRHWTIYQPGMKVGLDCETEADKKLIQTLLANKVVIMNPDLPYQENHDAVHAAPVVPEFPVRPGLATKGIRK